MDMNKVIINAEAIVKGNPMKKLLSLSLVLMCLLVSTKLSAIEVIDSRPDYSGGTYEEYTMDMKVKVLGGYVSIKRHYGQDGWLLHPNWQSLKFYDAAENEIVLAEYYQDPANTHADLIIGEIKRERYVYKPLSSQNKSTFRDQYDPSKSIVKTETGYRWESRTGDWIEYDQYGVAQKYGNKNDVTVTLVRDEKNRVKAIQDHFGNQVITIDHSVANQITVTDYDDRTITYHGSFPFISKVTDVRGNDWQYEYTEIKGKKYLSKKIDPENRETTIGHELVPGSVQTIITGDDNPTWTLEEYTDPDTGETVVRERMVESDSSASRSQFVPAMVMFTHLIYDDGARIDYKYYYNQQTKTYSSVSKTSDGIHRDQWFAPDGKLKRSSVGGKLLFTRAESQDGSKSVSIDAEGRKVTTHYDQWENPTKIVAADGSTRSYTYHPQLNYPVQIVDAKGIKTTNEFDAKGNLIKVTRGKGSGEDRVIEYEYDKYGQLIVVRHIGDKNTETTETVYYYDLYGNVEKIIDPENFFVLYEEFNSLGQPGLFVDARSKRWRFGYDQSGNIIRTISPMLFESMYEYNKVNNLVQYRDAENALHLFQYDSRGRLAKYTNPIEDDYIVKYQTDGRPIYAIDQSGDKINFTYDYQQRLKSVRNEEVIFVEYGYKNESSNALSQMELIETSSGVVKLTLDQRGRVVTQTTYNEYDSSLISTSYEYDSNNNVLRVTDAKSNQTDYRFSPHNEVVAVTDALDNETTLVYDRRGNLIEVSAPNNTTFYTYDRRNLRTSETQGARQTVSYKYDGSSNLIELIDGEGQVVNFDYNDDGMLIKEKHFIDVSATEPVSEVVYKYNKNGLLTYYSDGKTSANYELDELGRVIKVITNFGHFSKSYEHSYHKDGLLESFTNSESIKASYQYDQSDRLRLVTFNGLGSISYTEYSGMQPTKISYPGGLEVIQTYDGFGRLLTKNINDPAGKNLYIAGYNYDALSNVLSTTNAFGDFQYEYDELSQLTKVRRPDPFEDSSYKYDSLGNRVGTEVDSQEWLYNENNELAQYGNDNNKIILEYNKNGDLIKKSTPKGITEYTYDVRGNLVELIKDGTTVANYHYDPFGRRVIKETRDGTIFYLYDTRGLLAEYDEAGQLIVSYQYSPGANENPLAAFSESEMYFYHHDQKGTPEIITSSSGQIKWSSVIEPFGKSIIIVDDITNNFRHPGQYADPESGLYYNLHRYYDPEIGRYIQDDPIGLEGGVNRYIYAENNPSNNVDFFGLYSTEYKKIENEWNLYQHANPGRTPTINSVVYRGLKSSGLSTTPTLFQQHMETVKSPDYQPKYKNFNRGKVIRKVASGRSKGGFSNYDTLYTEGCAWGKESVYTWECPSVNGEFGLECKLYPNAESQLIYTNQYYQPWYECVLLDVYKHPGGVWKCTSGKNKNEAGTLYMVPDVTSYWVG